MLTIPRIAEATIKTPKPATPSLSSPAVKVRGKFQGYITAVSQKGTFEILEDVIAYDRSTKFKMLGAPPGRKFGPSELTVGMLVQVDGIWAGRHRLKARKAACRWDQFRAEIKGSGYFLEDNPGKLQKVANGAPSQVAVNGEVLLLDENTRVVLSQDDKIQPGAVGTDHTRPDLAGRFVRYRGVRREDGLVTAKNVEFGERSPAEAYEMGGVKVVRARDLQTDIDILEFRKKKKVLGRLKLFPVKEVQNYIARLGEELIPPSVIRLPSNSGIEFRFYVIEKADINASAFPDGTILVNTGLLAALKNEAQLAFILSHEITHVTQAHHWRHVHDTPAAVAAILIRTRFVRGPMFPT